jgi:prepilin-type N-terminal cleavage/methylation domain-containing protein
MSRHSPSPCKHFMNPLPTPQRNKNAFSLLELLVVVLIIGLLTAIVLPTFEMTQQRARLSSIPTFPWEPPQPSAFEIIPRDLLVGHDERPTLRHVAEILDLAFRRAGYGEKSYYSVPDGFAIASRLEQINPDGTPKDSSQRWSLDVTPVLHFSVSDYISALFKATPGHYRMVVFVVTPHPFKQNSKVKISPEDAKKWLAGGLNTLPQEIGARECTTDYVCTALIYEFRRVALDHQAEFVDPSQLTGTIHLQKSGLLGALAQEH